MSARKKFKLVHGANSSDFPTPKAIDWTLCCLCQAATSERLICPARSKKSNIGAGYKSVGDNLATFQQIRKKPVPVDISLLDEGEGISQTLEKHEACWHSSCRLNCSSSRIARTQSATKSDEDIDTDTPTTSHYIRSRSHGKPAVSTCFFCDKPETKEELLHDVMMPKVTERVKRCAMELEDQRLIAKLSAGDLVAQDARYHTTCLAKLYNAQSRHAAETHPNSLDRESHGIALAELMSFIEDIWNNDKTVAPVFRLADLTQLYTNRLKDLGVELSSRVHSTDLKNRLLANIPDIRAFKQGRDIVLTFKNDVGTALKEATLADYDDEAICLAKAAQIVRRDMQKKTSSFNGTFEKNCQEEAVPRSLLTLVGMIMHGTSIKAAQADSQPALSVAQLLQFNSLTRWRNISTGNRHSKEKETPLPVYLGLLLHGQTRKRELVDRFFHLGVSISYDRVLSISSSMAAEVAAQYQKDGAVCPFNLRRHLFTTAAIDNIDHNPSSTTSRQSFHGTGISMFQNRENESDGTKRDRHPVEHMPSLSICSLPEYYTNVTAVSLHTKEPVILPTEDLPPANDALLKSAVVEEQVWLEKTSKLRGDVQSLDDPISWAAYHGNLQTKNIVPSLNALLPLFPDDSKSIGMIRHSMDVVREAVALLNPGQVPVVALDQPLFAIAKQIQWNWPEKYGEAKFIVLLGGLHIEMAFLATIGDLLEGSGWTSSLVEAQITTPGRADALLKSSHVKRARYVHTVTCSTLWILLHQAYSAYCQEEVESLPFEDWCIQQMELHPQFQYWLTVLNMELLLLIFVRSLREGNFQLYLSSLSAIAPWFFVLDHTHYARWLPVHIRDMTTLHVRIPEVAEQFMQGKFVVCKTNRPFSAISVDHAHEQNNAIIKGTGGATDLMTNPRSMLRWMVAGPEIARTITEFETNCFLASKGESTQPKHHEHTLSSQTSFAKDVNALVDTISNMGNPFSEETSDLLVLDTRDIADPKVSQSIREMEKLGKLQFKEFTEERLKHATKSVTEPIPRNKLQLFGRQPVRNSSQSSPLVSSLKSDCALFSRLFVSCQTRDGDLENFFKHENHAYPPSLSQFGNLRSGTKSDIAACLEEYSPSIADSPVVDVLVLDGAAIICMLKPTGSMTFNQYAENVFLPYLKSRLKDVMRIDVVWDVYTEDSLKSSTRERRGKGIRRRVTPTTLIPGNWQEFLRVSENKTELFTFLATKTSESLTTEKEVILTCKQNVLSCCINRDLSALSPCTQEEADSRLFLHVADAVAKGYQKVMVRSVDSDVLVLAVYCATFMTQAELWVEFGVGKNKRFIAAHKISSEIGDERSKALPLVHAFTGCDTVSSFAGRGKKTAFQVWKTIPEITPEMAHYMVSPQEFDDTKMEPFEKFVILLYDRTCSKTSVDAARMHMFTTKGRPIDAIPPTLAALLQHTKRAIHQAAFVWGQMFVRCPDVPSPGSWGWRKGKSMKWEPLWTVLPEAAASCSELLRCACQKSCSGRCKCLKAALKCTTLCRCGGSCGNSSETL